MVLPLSDEASFRLLVEHLPVGILVVTGSEIRYTNPQALALFGATGPEQLRGTPLLDRIAPQDRLAVEQLLVSLDGSPRPTAPREENFLRLDGTGVPIELTLTAVSFQPGPGVMVVLRDLTEELADREALRQKDRLLRLTGALAQVGGWEIDAVTGQGSWTDEVARIHDLDPEISPNASFGLGFYTPGSRTQIEQAVNRAIAQAEPYDLVLELVSATGRHKWVRTQGYPVLEGSRVVKLQGTFQDVTAPWTAARALKEEKERLAITLRSIGDGVITTDTQGKVVLMSRSAEDLTGWTQAEAQGRPLDSVMPLVHEWTKAPLENPVRGVLRDGKAMELATHTVLLAKDGRERTIADSAAPILDQDGTITGIVLVFRDMTERERLNEALQRAQNLESIGILAAGIAHDFNNLLSGLFGQVQLAADKVSRGRPEEAAVNFDRALGVFDRARDLTGQLLTFSKGGVPVRVPLDLGALARKAVQFALSGSNVGVQFTVSPDLRVILGDPNQLAQAIDNLVINARQAMADGGTIDVTVEVQQLPEGRFAVLSVRDRGPGIPPEILPRIFDPFFTTKAGGNGLGLSAVQSIVQRHEGRVEVGPAPDRGTVFRIFLPAR